MTDESNNGEGYSPRYSHSDRVAATIARLQNHGSGVANTMGADSVRTSAGGVKPASYNTHTGAFRVHGVGDVTGAELVDAAQGGQIERVFDNGSNTDAERGKLQGELDGIRRRLEEISGYDVSGKPVLVLTGSARDQLLKYYDGRRESVAYAFDELAALDAQRARDAQVKAEMQAEDTAREARIDQHTAEAIERLEGEERARKILAARKKIVM